MKRLSATLAVIGLLGGGAVMAQTPPPPPEEPAPSTMAPSTPDPGTTSSSDKKEQKEQMKDCINQQRANDPQLSKHDAKKVCKTAVEGAPPSNR